MLFIKKNVIIATISNLVFHLQGVKVLTARNIISIIEKQICALETLSAIEECREL